MADNEAFEMRPVMDMTELDVAREIHTMLDALDTTLASVFKEHVATIGIGPEMFTKAPDLHLVNLIIMRNLARTMDKLQGMNPMALMKLMLGV